MEKISLSYRHKEHLCSEGNKQAKSSYKSLSSTER